MYKLRMILLICIATLIAGCCKKNCNEKSSTNTNQIFSKGDKINNDHFSGTAWLQMLVTNKEDFDLTIGNVIFEPGVRNNWHFHPGGQILICIAGQGYYQEKGQPIRILNKGDIIETLPNVVHWHGATPDSEFEHIAITTKSHEGSVVWLESVTDEEYKRIVKP